MAKISKNTMIIGSIVVIILIALCFGIHAFVQHINGTSPAQIEARQRAQEAAEQTENALKEDGQWYQDQMSEPVTVTNSDGEQVTYGTQVGTCINSSENN